MMASGLIGLVGCAGSDTSTPASYKISFTASRLKDQSPLGTASTSVALGQTALVRVDTSAATEDSPALPRFAVTLTSTRTPGVFQLLIKASVQEAARNKKGKLKRSQRFEGALLPIRLGETQHASASGDPVQIDVSVDRP